MKAERLAGALSDRLERHWDSLRMEMIYSRELGLTVMPERQIGGHELNITDSLALYQKLKGVGKNKFCCRENKKIRETIL